MYQDFKTKAEGVGAEVFRFLTRAEALEFILQLLLKSGVSANAGSFAAWADGSFLDTFDRTELSARVPGLRFDVNRQVAADSLVGISQADWAMADTGTLVLDSTAVEGRLVSTLTEIHIALLPTSAILHDMPTLLTRMHPDNSSYIAMITGPSRTADIERVLTIGVHGPSRLIIACVDDLGGAN